MKVHVISWCFRNALYEVYEFQKYKIIEVTSSMKPSYEQNGGQFPSADCTDKEFVGINITRDADFNYYMEKLRFHFLYNVSYSRLSMVYFECKFLYMTVELFPSIFMFLFESSIL